jgi:5S rRNA maturation endonuclease (ribonuclease M5)
MFNALKINLIEELGIADLPPEKQEEIISESATVVFKGILNRVVLLLSDKEKEEVNAILDKDNPGEEVYNYLKAHLPNFDEIVKEEIAEFKQETFDVMSKIG